MSDNIFMTGVVIGLTGGALLAYALLAFIRTVIFISQTKRVKGTVLRMIWEDKPKGGGGYHPEYQYTTLEGQQVLASGNLSSNPPMFREGEIVEVLYHSANYKNSVINKWKNLYAFPLLLGGTGLILGGVGIAIIYMN